MTVRVPPEKRKLKEYLSKPFKNREETENFLNEILDLMDREEYEEAQTRAVNFVTKLHLNLIQKEMRKRQQQDSKKQDKTQKTKLC